MDGMEEIINEFLIESHENLDQLDQDLIALETADDGKDLLARIFRTIHTIKGTSGFLAFNNLESVAHVGENLLAKLRDGVMEVDQHNTDIMLLMTDTIRNLLGVIEESGGDGSVDVSDVVARISAANDAAGAPKTAAAEEAPPADAAPATPEAAAEQNTSADPETAPPAEDGDTAPAAQVEGDAPAPKAEDKVEAPAEPAAAAAPATPAPAAEAKPAEDKPKPAAAPPAPAPASASNQAAGPKRSAADSVIRVDVEQLDHLMLLVGELVLTRNQIVQYASQQTDQTLVRSSQRLNLIASELQEGVMKTRMQPMDHLWNKFPRVVRDLGGQCGKNVRLEMVGKETELDRTLLEAVKDPLTHLVRNAVDHGLETAEARVAAGKPEQGVLTLRAFHEGGQVVVEVCDDGKGIDGAVIGAKAVEKGLKSESQIEAMSPQDLMQLIFLPGFSTATQVTNVSGRGVGMDVVKSNIEQIGGTIEVESKVGQGSVFRLRIPLTLAIVPALTVECGGDVYAIPQVNLIELVALDVENSEHKIEDVGGVPVYRLRGNLLPLVNLADTLKVDAQPEEGAVTIAVLNAEGRRFGLVLDRVISTEEIVVKPLASLLKSLGVYSGATILGDGRVALILDIQALARKALPNEAVEKDAQSYEETVTLGIEDADNSQVLVAGIGDGRQVGIPLAMVTRLEEINTSDVEYVGNREVLQYRGAILPLLRLDRHLGAYTESDAERLPLVVYTSGGRSIAIVVSEIVDIVDGDQTKTYDIDDQGLLGSAVIRDKVVELLDVRGAILAVDPVFFDQPETHDDQWKEAIRNATAEKASTV